jgi:hypothetical protein
MIRVRAIKTRHSDDGVSRSPQRAGQEGGVLHTACLGDDIHTCCAESKGTKQRQGDEEEDLLETESLCSMATTISSLSSSSFPLQRTTDAGSVVGPCPPPCANRRTTRPFVVGGGAGAARVAVSSTTTTTTTTTRRTEFAMPYDAFDDATILQAMHRATGVWQPYAVDAHASKHWMLCIPTMHDVPWIGTLQLHCGSTESVVSFRVDARCCASDLVIAGCFCVLKTARDHAAVMQRLKGAGVRLAVKLRKGFAEENALYVFLRDRGILSTGKVLVPAPSAAADNDPSSLGRRGGGMGDVACSLQGQIVELKRRLSEKDAEIAKARGASAGQRVAPPSAIIKYQRLSENLKIVAASSPSMTVAEFVGSNMGLLLLPQGEEKHGGDEEHSWCLHAPPSSPQQDRKKEDEATMTPSTPPTAERVQKTQSRVPLRLLENSSNAKSRSRYMGGLYSLPGNACNLEYGFEDGMKKKKKKKKAWPAVFMSWGSNS